MLKFFVACLLFCSTVAFSQISYSIDQSISVINQKGEALDLAWAGGLNSTQYNTMDINRDGKDDLVLYDRMAKKVITFLQDNNRWQYAPEYEYFFPSGITNWLLLRDFNCDGKKDVFTGDALGIKVFLNTQTGASPTWTQLKFSSSANSKSDVLLTKGFSGKINIQLQHDDLPALVDADGDGDIDIFNMRFVGGTIEFHKNVSKEKYGTCDSLEFERVTQAWGNVADCYCGTFSFNDGECSTSGRLKHTGGKSLLFLDGNSDQHPDMLFSEAECSSVFLLQNDKGLFDAAISRSANFPADDPAQLISYPAAYLEDVDFDLKKDLIFSSNDFSKDEAESNLAESNIFYKNTGTNSTPVFSRVQNNFLQDRMIDVGDNSVPAFADFDGDGDNDLFVSSNSSDNQTSRISHFENIGNEQSPSFKLANDDYLEFSKRTLYNAKIQFVDVNADNVIDLVFTASDLQKSGTRLYYMLNKGAVSLDFNSQPIVETDFTVNYDENVHLADINQDGIVDVLVGRSSGKLEYWVNTANETKLEFNLVDEDFLKLNTTGFNQNISCTVNDVDNDGLSDLVYTDGNGALNIISDFQSKTDASSKVDDVILNAITNKLVQPNFGIRNFITVANIFGTTKPAIIMGNILGGLSMLKNTDTEPLSETPSVDVFPNPADGTKIINIKTDRPATVQIISTLGQKINDGFVLQAHQTYQYRMAALQAGIYFLKFDFHNESVIKRIVLY
jgi:hypothetical protein